MMCVHTYQHHTDTHGCACIFSQIHLWASVVSQWIRCTAKHVEWLCRTLCILPNIHIVYTCEKGCVFRAGLRLGIDKSNQNKYPHIYLMVELKEIWGGPQFWGKHKDLGRTPVDCYRLGANLHMCLQSFLIPHLMTHHGICKRNWKTYVGW